MPMPRPEFNGIDAYRFDVDDLRQHRCLMLHRPDEYRSTAGGDVPANSALAIAARHISANGVPERRGAVDVAAEGVPGEAGILGAQGRQTRGGQAAPLVDGLGVGLLHPADFGSDGRSGSRRRTRTRPGRGPHHRDYVGLPHASASRAVPTRRCPATAYPSAIRLATRNSDPTGHESARAEPPATARAQKPSRPRRRERSAAESRPPAPGQAKLAGRPLHS